MTVSIEGTTPGIAVDGTGAVVNVTVTTGDGGGGGVTDHGLLTGLSDDDHTQYAKKASNLSDLASAATARTNLGLGTAAVAATGDFDAAGTAAGLVDDLSGVSNQATARTNLGLGTAATAATGDFAAASHTHTGSQVTVDASGFNGNLTTSDDTVQEVAQKLDDLSIPAAGIPASTIDGKGELLVGSANDAVDNLAIGTDGHVLTLDSAQTLGVKWAAASGGIADPGGANDDFLQRKSGAWTYRTVAQVKTDLGVSTPAEWRISPILSGVKYPVAPMGITGSNDANLTANKIRGLMFPMSIAWNLEEVWCQVTSAAAAGKNLRMGLWSLTNAYVPTLLWDSGSIAADSTGTKKATSIGLNGNPPGLYLLGILPEATTGARLFHSQLKTWVYGTPPSAGVMGIFEWSHTYGTLPTTPTLAGVGSDQTYFPLIMVTSV